MGTPLPENPSGVHCTNCWDVGKPFAGEKTPYYITMRFKDYTPGDEWRESDRHFLDEPHTINQTASPCLWLTEDEIFTWWIDWAGFNPSARIRRKADFAPAFNSFSTTGCLLTYPNGLVLPTFNVTYHGHVELTWFQEDS